MEMRIRRVKDRVIAVSFVLHSHPNKHCRGQVYQRDSNSMLENQPLSYSAPPTASNLINSVSDSNKKPRRHSEQDTNLDYNKRRRTRKSYSCGNCRHRKVKCDRIFPCRQCYIRDIDDSCGMELLTTQYQRNIVKSKLQSGGIEPSKLTISHNDKINYLHDRTNSFQSTASQNSANDAIVMDDLHKTLNTIQAHTDQVQKRLENTYSNEQSNSFVKRPVFQIQSTADYTPDTLSLNTVLAKIQDLNIKFDFIVKHLQDLGNTTTAHVQYDKVTQKVEPSQLSLQQEQQVDLTKSYVDIAIDDWFATQQRLNNDFLEEESSAVKHYSTSTYPVSAPAWHRGQQTNDYFSF
jgi:hypothetical protein